MKNFIFAVLLLFSFNAFALTVTLTWTPPTTDVNSNSIDPNTDIQKSTVKCGTSSNSYIQTVPWTVDIFSDSSGFIGTSTLVVSDTSITRVFCAVSVTGQPYVDGQGVSQPGFESANSPEINFNPHTPTFVVPGALTPPGTPIVTITQ